MLTTVESSSTRWVGFDRVRVISTKNKHRICSSNCFFDSLVIFRKDSQRRLRHLVSMRDNTDVGRINKEVSSREYLSVEIVSVEIVSVERINKEVSNIRGTIPVTHQ